MSSGIYQIRNLVNNKIYIGSSATLELRNVQHFSDLRNCRHINKHLQNAFNKYGEENFVFEILEYCTIEYLITYEQEYIDNLNPVYNIYKKAGSPLGYSWTKEAKERMSRLLTGKRQGKNNNKAKAVLQIDRNTGEIIQEFDYILGAQKTLGIDAAHISDVCNGKRKSAGGYKWRYA